MPPTATPETAAAEAPAGLRRMPTQRRSRERVERMLAAAAALIGEGGSEQMRMSEVAERAGVSIGSLYQYFPDKAAIVRTLAQRCNAESRECIRAGLEDVRDTAGLARAFGDLIDSYYALFRAEPVMCDIWSGTQADKALHDIELADSRANAAILADAMMRIQPGADRAALEAVAFLVMHLGEATMRLAVSVDEDEGAAMVAAYKGMALAALDDALRRPET